MSWSQLSFTCKDREALAYAMFLTHAHPIPFGGVPDYNTETIHHGCLRVDLPWYFINELSYILLISNLRWQLGINPNTFFMDFQSFVEWQVKFTLVCPYWST